MRLCKLVLLSVMMPDGPRCRECGAGAVFMMGGKHGFEDDG